MGRNRANRVTGEKRRAKGVKKRAGHTKSGEPRSLRGPTTHQQAALLRRHGLSVPDKKQHAHEVIEYLSRVGWVADQQAHELADWYAQGGEPAARAKASKGKKRAKKKRKAKHKSQGCCRRTRKGHPCPREVTVTREGKRYCEIHDPEGDHQRQKSEARQAPEPFEADPWFRSHEQAEAALDERLAREK